MPSFPSVPVHAPFFFPSKFTKKKKKMPSLTKNVEKEVCMAELRDVVGRRRFFPVSVYLTSKPRSNFFYNIC